MLLADGAGGFAAPGAPVAVGTHPHCVAIADFNRDGRADLATANNDSSDVSVLLGNGAGGFSPAAGSPVTVGTNPTTLTIGDFNRDGKADLATSNEGSDNITVLLGNGAGGFATTSGSPIPVGTHPTWIVSGDLNRDGKRDLATANRDSNNVTVLLGDGAGGFAPAPRSPFAVGSVPHSVAIGDLNSDGRLDLATGNQASNDVTVLRGNGAGSFSPAPASPFAVGTLPTAIAIGDLNADQRPDLATADRTDDRVTVLLGTRAGRFSAGPGSPFAVGDRPRSITIADVNGDGRPDIATPNEWSNNVSLLLNTTPPNTKITSGPSGSTRNRTPAFGFRSTESNSSYACRVDGGRFRDCSSPHKASRLSYGHHTFKVRAMDGSGSPDPTPAKRRFRVVRRR